MFNSAPKKFYYVAPIDDGGGYGGGMTNTSISLTNVVIPIPTYADLITPFSLPYKGSIVGDASWRFDYFKITEGGVTFSAPQKISVLGNDISNTGSTATGTGSTTLLLNRKIPNLTGVYVDRWGLNGALYDTKYLILQKAVTIVKYSTLDGTIESSQEILAYNSTKNISDTSQYFYLDKSASRGKEGGAVWTFWKVVNDEYVTAIQGADYEIETINEDKIKLKFLINANFKVRLSVSGYTFADNPYEKYPTLTTGNTSTAEYFFNTTSATFELDVKFPMVTLKLEVPEEILLSNIDEPFKTYQNQLISVTPQLDLSDSHWIQYATGSDVSTGTTIEKTSEQWEDAMKSRLNITLEIRNKSNNELVGTRDGLDPYTIFLQEPQTYTLQVKTTLK